MRIKEILSGRLSRQDSMGLVGYIGDQQDRFDELFALFCNGEQRVVQNASWVVNHCVQHNPSLIEGKFKELEKHLANPKHDAVKRNVIRLLQFVKIPTNWQGIFYDHCFRLAYSAKEPIAVRSFSLLIIFQIAKDQPYLLEELEELLQDCEASDSPGILSRVRNLRKEIRKIRKQRT